MKKFSVVLFLVAISSAVFAGNLRDYRFRGEVKTSADPVYIGGVIYDALLFSEFSADNAILNKNSVYEVEKSFNMELKKQLIKYGVNIYDFEIIAFTSSERSSQVQTGTLEIDLVDETKVVEYDVNLVDIVNTVISGEIEYFDFNDDFENSYAVISLKLYERDSGKVLWLSTLEGTCGGIVDYISDTLTHEPIDMSYEAMQVEVEEEVDEEIMSRLPEITLAINPQNVEVKDPTKLPKATFNIDVDSTYEITSWSIDVYDMEENLVKIFVGTGDIPSKTTWDLTDEEGNVVDYADYKVVVTVTDELGNSVSTDLKMSVTEVIEE